MLLWKSRLMATKSQFRKGCCLQLKHHKSPPHGLDTFTELVVLNIVQYCWSILADKAEFLSFFFCVCVFPQLQSSVWRELDGIFCSHFGEIIPSLLLPIFTFTRTFFERTSLMNNSGFFFMTISTSIMANFFDKFSSMRRVFSKIVDGIS